MATVESGSRFYITVSEGELHSIIEALRCIAGSKLPEEGERYEALANDLVRAVSDRIFVTTAGGLQVPRCRERESGGYRCELPDGHAGNHECPKALENFSRR